MALNISNHSKSKKPVKGISVIIPFYNEQENVESVYITTKKVLETDPMLKNIQAYEIIFIDDGSQDQGYDLIRDIALRDKDVKAIRFAFNCGQTAAIQAGFNIAKHEVVIPMDADMQNDPRDIGFLVQKIEEGYDVVSGWRKQRQDKLWTRKLPSMVANWLISKITHVSLHDYGCSLKAYRKNIVKRIRLYGEMHRFIPIYAYWNGARITEIPVQHHSRQKGSSKYGLLRTFKVLLDLVTLKFMGRYATRPLHFFGVLGFFSFFLAGIGFLYVIYKQIQQGSFIDSPIFLFSVMEILLGAHFILMGLLAEIQIRIYHESQGKPPYVIEEEINVSALSE